MVLWAVGLLLSPNTETSCFKERCLIKQKSRKEKSWRRQFLAYPNRHPYPGFWRIYLSQTCTQVMRFCVGLPTSSPVAFWCVGNQVKCTGTSKRIELRQPGDWLPSGPWGCRSNPGFETNTGARHLVRFRMALVNRVMTACSWYKDVSVLCQEIAGIQPGSKGLAERYKSF